MFSGKTIELFLQKDLIYTALVGADGQLCRAGFYNPKGHFQAGDVYFVRLLKMMPALSGVFALLGKEQEGFLPLRKKIGLKEGDFVAVSIKREAQHGKGARLRLKPNFHIPEQIKEQKKICRLQRGKSLATLWAEEFPDAEIISPHPETVFCLSQEIRQRFRIDYQAFDSGLQEAFEALGETILDLGEGILAQIRVTEALTAIDLDAPQGAGFEENRRAIETLLHAIALRELGGVILIDPAGLALKKRYALTKFIQQYAQKTESLERLKILGATPSGMIELSAKWDRKSLFEHFNPFENRKEGM